ncbi:MAG: SelB C-terminal domain-containing protein, partial [Gemmatimonadota bacterium]|nr:SelB C-terminal domain-containing protein [Gemmatimonadota bacterium]
VVARAGDPFILRFYSPIELLGGGRVGELDPPRKWRDRTEDWEICLGPSAAESAAAALRLAGARGYTVDELRLAMPHRAPAALPEDWRAVRIGERWFDPDQLTRMCGELLSWLDRAHVETPLESGVALQALRAAVGRDAAAELVEEAIRRLADRGEIVIDGPRVRSAGFQVELLDDQVAARDALMEAISGAGLMPPTPPDLAASIAVPRPLVNDLLNLLVESGSLVRITPDLLLTETAERELRDTALGVLRRLDEPSPADFRTALGVTRRYLIPMLEYLDGIGWTERSAGGRVPGPAARVAIGEPQDG